MARNKLVLLTKQTHECAKIFKSEKFKKTVNILCFFVTVCSLNFVNVKVHNCNLQTQV